MNYIIFKYNISSNYIYCSVCKTIHQNLVYRVTRDYHAFANTICWLDILENKFNFFIKYGNGIIHKFPKNCSSLDTGVLTPSYNIYKLVL